MDVQAFNVGGEMRAQPFHVQRLGHVGLTVANLAGAISFFTETLGFRMTDVIQPPGLDRPLACFTNYGTDHHSLVLVDAMAEAGSPHYARGVTVNQISFQVGTLREVANAYEYFADKGIETWRYGRDWPGSNWAVYAYDPDGFRVELFYGMEQIGWQQRSKPVEFYQHEKIPEMPEPAEMGELAAVEAAHPILSNSFRPPEPLPLVHEVGGVMLERPFSINKLGPVYLFVDDIDVSEAFYVEHLGLVRSEEVAWQGHSVRFLRYGADHHAVGLFPIAMRESLGLDTRTRLMSVGVEVGSYDQLRGAVDWLRAKEFSVVTDFPQMLRPGIEHAAFVTEPNGHMAMLYCGMEQIGWDGRARSSADRTIVDDVWPATRKAIAGVGKSLVRQGPMG